MKLSLLAATVAIAALSSPLAQAGRVVTIPIKKPKVIVDPYNPVYDAGAGATQLGLVPNPDNRVVKSFEGSSDYDVRRLNGFGFTPPDTMGAVGDSQFVELVNGSFTVFDKKTGKKLVEQSDAAFWASVGQDGTEGDPRVLYNSTYDRWLMIEFGADVKDINIAVSDTSDATGTWKATKFEGFSIPGAFRSIADYPTLAMDNNAVYIGTNNFAQETSSSPTFFFGTTLNVLPIGDLFSASGPTVANNQQFSSGVSTLEDLTYGFAIQGVNSNEASTTGNVVAGSLLVYGFHAYDILNAGTAGATRTAATTIDTDDYSVADAARQPGHPGNAPLRNIDSLDDRTSSNAWEQDGKTYFVQTISLPGTDAAQIRITVIDSVTKDVLQQLDLGEAGYDYYQGSIAVTKTPAGYGRAVVGYNRSGYDADTGKIRFYTQILEMDENGLLSLKGDAVLLKESVSPGYLNGAPEASGVPVGRQRWGDYSAVTVDPNDPTTFWAIGQFAREAYTQQLPGFPPPSGFSRWGTWISAVTVPEPSTIAPLFLGVAGLGLRFRKRKA